MTNDFVDQLEEACEKEEVPYLVVVQAKDGNAAEVRSDLDGWKTCNIRVSVREDILQLLEVTAFDPGYGDEEEDKDAQEN